MNTIRCPGLDGSNPLHFLASLGVMRLVGRSEFKVKMGWYAEQGCWHPFFSSNEYGTENDIAQQLFMWTKELGKTSTTDSELKKKARDLSAKIKKDESKKNDLLKSRRLLSKGKNTNSTCDDLDKQIGQLDEMLSNERTQLAAFQVQMSNSLGQGIAHLGDIIGVDPQLFRLKAKSALDKIHGVSTQATPAVDDAELVVACLPSLACDQIFEGGALTYTPFSFSNGGSGQCLLKDFRECAKTTTVGHIRETLFGSPIYETTLSSLGWDPSDQSLYAMQWQAPEIANKKGTKKVDPAIQTLAYVGLSLLPALPIKGGLAAVGWKNDYGNKTFCWPIWDQSISLDVVMSALALNNSQVVNTLGVATVFSVSIQNPNGKRNFFSPSRSL